MWFGVIATLKNQRTGTMQSNWNGENILYSTVPNQELSSDRFVGTVRLPQAVHAYTSSVPVCDSLPVQ